LLPEFELSDQESRMGDENGNRGLHSFATGVAAASSQVADDRPAAPMLRISLEMEPGSLPAVLACLQVAGQSPSVMEFHREERIGIALLDFSRINDQAARVLCLALKEVPGVVASRIER
jgi:hypothetical protein